ncbi:6-phosphogluconolactonase [Leptolyngbyaceae cyanobacterium CCMR0082]|uniref:6-phosphogluconolactonase n=1 Tax=Adonisia turfae CCMR0082 TaxID=2304604 RepID=A0A6M0S7I7_9CYAN|nr:6-phosphogluconolactonase [Adonisia turfae]MDV3347621.1 6-phosphogluconolactonase [Leptothoe sp. LEGE 181152]NEZ64425.1 6-phosphogluconolactonase [Adonisia turfae CCMR0082]
MTVAPSSLAMPQVHVYVDKAALVAAATDQVIELIRDAIATRGRCSIALSGGSTPKPLYQALAQTDLPWEQLYIYWGDERYVPATHADSNAKMTYEAWLNHVAIPAENIFTVPTETDSPNSSADQYQQALATSFDTTEIPAFDIILLGMGDDGHTASLFPHTEALNETERWVTVGQKADQPRITLTAPVINQARHVMFLVAGANKQTALSQVFAPTADSATYPARLVSPTGELRWLLDQDASAGLPASIERTLH